MQINAKYVAGLEGKSALLSLRVSTYTFSRKDPVLEVIIVWLDVPQRMKWESLGVVAYSTVSEWLW